jgi:hypothetical protein
MNHALVNAKHSSYSHDLKRLLLRIIVLAISLSGLAFSAYAVDFSLPPDTGVVNVKSDHGAKGDGVTDDTVAIQNAITAAFRKNDRYTRPVMLYFPNGTYRISNTLESRDLIDQSFSFGWRSGMILVGESRDRTVIKLSDNLAAYASPQSPKAMIKTGSENPKSPDGGNNEAFRHSIINMTLNTGNNPGAIGIDYLANNRGSIEHVTIASSGTRGARGIAMDREWPGPSLIKNVSIDGFTEGITLRSHFQYGVTFEHLQISNITSSAIYTQDNPLWIRKLNTNNIGGVSVAIDGTNSSFVILDSRFDNGNPAQPAVLARSAGIARNVCSTGYVKLIDSETGKFEDVAGGMMAGDYSTHAVTSLNPSPAKTLNLPIEETPEYYNNNFADWANVNAFGATVDNAQDDDTPGIQRAIDSGKPMVYLPNGAYHLKSPLFVRGNVKKIIGFQSLITIGSGAAPDTRIEFSGDANSSAIMEHLWINAPLLHNGQGSWTFRHADAGDQFRITTSAVATGKLFLEDVIVNRVVLNGPIKLWARQLNIEFGPQDPLFQNNGGTAWLFGYKTEGEQTAVFNGPNSSTEILGGYFYPLRSTGGTPMIVNQGALSVTYRNAGSTPYGVTVEETRNGQTTRASADQTGYSAALYTGYVAPTGANTFTAGDYTLTARHSGLLLDVPGSTSAGDTVLWQYGPNGTAAQEWQIDPLGNAAYRVVSKASGQCLDVRGANSANGAAVIQYPCNGGASQQWRIEATDSGFSKLVASHSGKVLDVVGQSTASNTPMQQWEYGGGLNQQWKLTKIR